MTKYNIGDIFECLDIDDYRFRGVAALQIIARYKNSKDIITYTFRKLYGLKDSDPNEWRWKKSIQENISLNRYKLGEMLKDNKLRLISADKAALLLLKHNNSLEAFNEDR
jgi:hypothetical protein